MKENKKGSAQKQAHPKLLHRGVTGKWRKCNSRDKIINDKLVKKTTNKLAIHVSGKDLDSPIYNVSESE